MNTSDPGSPSDSPLDNRLTYRISRLHHAFGRQAADVLAAHGDLSVGQWRMLVTLIEAGAETSGDIVRQTGLDGGFVGRTLASLATLGFVSTERSRIDRRSLSVTVTEAGRTAFEAARPAMMRRQEAFDAALTPAERDAFVEALDKLEAAAERREF